MCHPFALIGSPTTLLILGVLAVLLFGERLPEIARSVGKVWMEIQKGVQGIQREIENAVSSTTSLEPPTRRQEPERREDATTSKFDPPSPPTPP